MECKKLTDKEYSDWMALSDSEYADSSLHNSLDEESFYVISAICGAAATDDFEWMLDIINNHLEVVAQASSNDAFRRLLKRAYEHAVACGDAGSCCNLANMYHDTDNAGTEEDYETARELYELGADRGDDQSSVNLGYLYYYGRGMAPDYLRAYECFARAALLTDNPEGYWKLGDLYASGKGVPKSHRTAWSMYSRAYHAAGESPLAARAAHHLADYLMTGIDGFLQPDPDKALRLYNEAELGYYRLIESGLSYYGRQLDQVIEGQKKARAASQELHHCVRAQ